MFAYGLVSVVLVLHLAAAGLDEARVGLLLTLTLLGDAGKGIVPVLIAAALGYAPPQLTSIAFAAFLGHLYPIY